MQGQVWKRSPNPDSKDHGANMGPIWVLSTPDGPHVGPMNRAIRELDAQLSRVWMGAWDTRVGILAKPEKD